MPAAASRAPKRPKQPPKGAPAIIPIELSDDLLEKWEVNTKIKTCKCEPCSERVRKWSVKCKECGRHLCSECLSSDSDRGTFEKKKAHDELYNGCWHRFSSNMNPEFAHLKRDPPKRLEEEQRARESKRKAAETKAAKAAKEAEAEAEEAANAENAVKRPRQPSFDSSTASPASTTKADPDDDYKPSASNSTRLGSKRKRTTTDDPTPKSKIPKYTDGETRITEPSGELQAPELDLSRLDGGRTVIVGAGFIGLAVAHQLALEASRLKVDHQITVIEARSGHCELASQHCNGFLSAAGVPQEWMPLVELSTEEWLKTIGEAGFDALGFSKGTLVKVPGGGNQMENCPVWLKGDGSLSLAHDSKAMGRM
jgi:hypothetical protein